MFCYLKMTTTKTIGFTEENSKFERFDYGASNKNEMREKLQDVLLVMKTIKHKIEIERKTHSELNERDRKCSQRYICKLEKELEKWSLDNRRD